MTTAIMDSPACPPPSGGLPVRMLVLYISSPLRTGGWLAEAFAADSASAVRLDEAVGSAAGLARLRDEVFDAVLISHDPGQLDALELTEGYRAGGSDEPVIVLGVQSEQEMAALCYEVRADAYVCVNTATTRQLIWVVARSVERHHLIRENRRLFLAEQRRLQREHEEAEQLLLQQRRLIDDLEAMRQTARGEVPQDPTSPDQASPREISAAGVSSADGLAPDEAGRSMRNQPPPELPAELVTHYRELLRTYVIMGSGNLGCEMARLAELLTGAGVSARQTMQLHLHVLEELINGLGARSTRHVMTRADLLALEITIHLAEGYRHRYQERKHPPIQQILPGFE